MIYYKLLGVIGLLLIIVGDLLKKKDRRKRDYTYILGGFLLVIYSYFIGDLIFIILQVVFTFAAIYDLSRLERS